MNERRQDFESLQRFTRAGEQSAFADVVRRHLDLVFGTAMRKVEDAGAAQEVSQNVFAALGIQIPPTALRRFWMMLAHYHGQVFNASDLGRSLSVADTTVRRFLDTLVGTLMVRRLAPWFENIDKRQVKTPKICFRDRGLLHRLAGVNDAGQLHTWPRLGPSWEGFALEEIIRLADATEEEAHFWAVHSQGELGLLIVKDGRRLGFEFKYADSPQITSACRMAMKQLKLDQLTLVCPGDATYELEDGVRVRGLNRLVSAGKL